MNSDLIKKYTVFILVVMVLVAVDQWTKWYAEQRLATAGMSHMQVVVGDDFDGATLQDFLNDELASNTDDEVSRIASEATTDVDGQRMRPDDAVEAGQTVEIRHREVVVIEDFWDYQYTRNPGAAFGLMADADENFRKPFFIVVSLLAVLLIVAILHQVPLRQWVLFSALTLIAAGALGNFFDRIQYGYVIDFVVWKYTDEYRWPTFNVADALICVGVALMVVEIIRDGLHGPIDGEDGESDEAQ